MDAQLMRRRCEARLRCIVLPNSFTIETFTASVSKWQGRPIELVASAMPPGLHGLLVPEGATDYLFHRTDTTPLHRCHIILHELAHLVCGHRGVIIDAAVSFRDLIAHADGIATLLAQYSQEDEAEAEMFATLVLARTEGAGRTAERDSSHAAHTRQVLHDLTGMAYEL